MKFCRSCGTGLAAVASAPGIGGGAQNMGYGGAPAPMGAPGNPPPMMSPPMGGSPMGGSPMGGPMSPPPMGAAPAGPMAGSPASGPMGAPYGSPMGSSGAIGGGPGAIGGGPGAMPGAMGGPGAMSGPGAMGPGAPPANVSPMFAATMAQDGPGPAGANLSPMGAGGAKPGAASSAGASGMINCPRCGTPTPVGFAYCQQCGLHMSALQPTDPGANARARPPSSGGIGGSLGGSGRPPSSPAIGAANVDGHAMTLATDGGRPSPMAPSSPAIRPQTGPAWGTAVLVNRDGSDGQRFPLAGEYCVIGRAGADIAFDDDRFLARQHARFERASDGSVKVEALDALNGVFRKADLPVDLVDGTVILVGREVLRYEKVDAEEIKVHPLVRHGVALFGSPPREPWGRLLQIIPSGGYRDVRHLVGEEVVLGREEGDIVFRDDAFMSRRHAAVTWDGNKAQITDLGSSNGTFVRITQATPIKHGDHVRMGDQLLRIELGK